MRSVSDKRCRENHDTHFVFDFFFFFENRVVYEAIWKFFFRTGHATGENMAHGHFSPSDAQLDSLKNNFKFALKLTLKSCYMFRCETLSSG